MSTVSKTGVYFDPYDVDINADPYPTYARLREEAPIYHNERYDFWALSRHADVEKALVNWQTFSNTRSDILDIIKAGVELPPGVLLFEDPPIHTMHRGLMSRVFTPRSMAALEDQVREFCVRCLDPLVGSGGFDIVAELGSVMPMRVIGMLLGIPEEDQIAVRNKTDANLRTEPGKPMKVQRGRGRERRHVRRLHRVALHASVRRPDDPFAECRVRGRDRGVPEADPPGSPHLYGSDRRCGQRDDRAAHRLARQAACRASRSTTRGRRGSLVDPECHRRDAEVRANRSRHCALRHGRRRLLRLHRARGKSRSCCYSRRRTATHGGTPTPTCTTSSGRTSST